MRTLTLCSNLLKTVYEDLWSDALNYGTPLRAKLMQMRKPASAQTVTFPVKYALVQSGGARGDNEDLPTPGSSKEYPSSYSMKYNYWTVGWTGPAVAATENKSAAFANAFTQEMADAQKAFMTDLNRQLFGNGQCQLCLANGAHSGTLTLTVDNGISGDTTDGTTRRLYPGMLIDAWTSTTKEIDGAEISTIDSATQATMLSNVTCTDNAIIVRKGNRLASTYHELTGLAGLIGTSGTVQSIDSSTYTWWQSPGTQTTLGALDHQDMINCCQKVSQKRSDGDMPDLIVTTDGVINSYRETLEDSVRLDPLNIVGGYQAIGFYCGGREIPMITDLDCTWGDMWFLSTDQLEVRELLAMKWDDRWGTEFYPTQRRDSWEARMVYYSNLMTRARWAHSKLSGITETTT